VAESWVINTSPVILLAKAGLISSRSSSRPTIPEPVAAEIQSCRTVDAAVG
jgi:hypothetical protein